MRRYNPPFNGKRYVLNHNTHEVHDLDRETSACHINEINPEHVRQFDSYDDAWMFSFIVDDWACNGCAHCMPEKNNS